MPWEACAATAEQCLRVAGASVCVGCSYPLGRNAVQPLVAECAGWGKATHCLPLTVCHSSPATSQPSPAGGVAGGKSGYSEAADYTRQYQAMMSYMQVGRQGGT